MRRKLLRETADLLYNIKIGKRDKIIVTPAKAGAKKNDTFDLLHRPLSRVQKVKSDFSLDSRLRGNDGYATTLVNGLLPQKRRYKNLLPVPPAPFLIFQFHARQNPLSGKNYQAIL